VANEKLQAEMTKRARLEQEILLISEREKTRIGEELHDTLCQELAASAFLLKSHAEKIGKQQPKVSDALLEAAQIVNANVGLARDLARGLHPIELSTAGLVGALRDLCYRTNQTGRVECQFDCPREIRVRDDAIALNLYRIAQEAVTNALKHGQPQCIWLSLRRARSALTLKVRDNGKGITARRDGGMGLEIMQHRANVIGGGLVVESNEGTGTTVTCTLPGG
jgi:signal transduction histidine kinase